MARKRMLDPNLYEDPEVGSLSFGARWLFIGLISNADDEGRGTADPRQLKKMIFGYDDVTSDQVREWLSEIVEKLSRSDGNGGSVQNVVIYESEGRPFYFLRNWRKYQVISHPSASRLPAPPADLGSGHFARDEWEGGLDLREAHALVLEASGIGAVPATDPQWMGRIENVRSVMQNEARDLVLECLTEARKAWVSTPRKDNKGTYSVLNPGWVDWGIVYLGGEKPWENNGGGSKMQSQFAKIDSTLGGKDGKRK